MKGCIPGFNQSRNFFPAKHPGKVAQLLRIGRHGDAPATLQHVNMEEAQRRQPQDDRVRAELELGEQAA
jgi:hypothetical protein